MAIAHCHIKLYPILGCSGLLTISTNFFPWIEALAFLIAAAGILAARGSWAFAQERFRSQNNLCLRCGYSLTALPTNICPECGKPFNRTHSATPPPIDRQTNQRSTR